MKRQGNRAGGEQEISEKSVSSMPVKKAWHARPVVPVLGQAHIPEPYVVKLYLLHKGTMTEPKNKDPLQGITLERIVTDLHAKYGWEFLAGKVSIRCFRENPSITSSLKFLRKTPWARAKVERLYLRLISRSGVKRSRTYTAKNK